MAAEAVQLHPELPLLELGTLDLGAARLALQSRQDAAGGTWGELSAKVGD